MARSHGMGANSLMWCLLLILPWDLLQEVVHSPLMLEETQYVTFLCLRKTLLSHLCWLLEE